MTNTVMTNGPQSVLVPDSLVDFATRLGWKAVPTAPATPVAPAAPAVSVLPAVATSAPTSAVATPVAAPDTSAN